MNREPPKNPKSYKTAALLFSVSGFIFIMLSAFSGKIGVFLPVGIALVIVGINFSRLGKKLTNS